MPLVPALVQASHPEPTLAVTGIVTALAVSTGLGAGAAWVAAAVLAGQLSIGWSNDWIDAARDVRSGRTDKPVVRGEVPVRVLRSAALVAAAACVPLSLAMGTAAGLVHLAAVAGAWAYNVRLKGTVLSFLPYALAFGAAPSTITLGLDGRPLAPWWATVAGVLLGVGAHLCNTLPDLEDDRAEGVRGLPHRLGSRLSAALAAVLLLGAALILAFGPGRPGFGPLGAVGAATLLTAGGLLRSRRPGSRAAFRASLLVAGLCVALLVSRGAVLAPG